MSTLLNDLMRGLGERFGALRARVEDTEAEIRSLRTEIEFLKTRSAAPRIVGGRDQDAA